MSAAGRNTGSYLVCSNPLGNVTPPPSPLPFVRPPVLCHPLRLALCLLFGWVLRSWLWGQKELARPGPAQPAQHQVKCLWQPTAQLLTVIYHHRALDPAGRGGVHKRALLWAQRPLSLRSHTKPNTYFNTYFTSFHILHLQFFKHGQSHTLLERPRRLPEDADTLSRLISAVLHMESCLYICGLHPYRWSVCPAIGLQHPPTHPPSRPSRPPHPRMWVTRESSASLNNSTAWVIKWQNQERNK